MSRQSADVAGDAITSSGQFLSFTLGGDEYGIDILRVQEIRGWEKVRALPDSPDYVRGVLDLRGTIVPIVDLRRRFGLDCGACTPTTVVIILSVCPSPDSVQLVGAVVDGVSDVLDVGAAQIRPAPQIGTPINRRYLHGMFSNERGMVVLINVDVLFREIDLEQFDAGAD